MRNNFIVAQLQGTKKPEPWCLALLTKTVEFLELDTKKTHLFIAVWGVFTLDPFRNVRKLSNKTLNKNSMGSREAK